MELLRGRDVREDNTLLKLCTDGLGRQTPLRIGGLSTLCAVFDIQLSVLHWVALGYLSLLAIADSPHQTGPNHHLCNVNPRDWQAEDRGRSGRGGPEEDERQGRKGLEDEGMCRFRRSTRMIKRL